MKKNIQGIIIAAGIFMECLPVSYAQTSVNMQIDTNTVTRKVTPYLYGLNNEWWSTEKTYLGKDYGKTESFKQDFRDEAYTNIMPAYGELYFNPSDDKIRKYIKNGLSITSNASQSSVVFDGALYENQIINGVVQRPVSDVLMVENNRPSFAGFTNPELKVGGLDGYVGFTSTYDFQFRYGEANEEPTDMLVMQENENNFALHMNPTQNGRVSYFGKENVSISDKTTSLSFRVKIKDRNGIVRLDLVRDGDLGNIERVWNEHKFSNVSTAQFLQNNGKAQWIDVVTVNGGKVCLGKNKLVCTMDTDKWYTLEYCLNTEDINNANHMLIVKDELGNEIARSESEKVITGEKTDINELKNFVQCFEFSKDSIYSYMISAQGSPNTSVFIDDFIFKPLRDKYDIAGSVNMHYVKDLEGYPMTITRMAGGSAMWFDWKKGRGDVNQRENVVYAKTTDDSGTVTEWKAPEKMGIAEWVKTTKEINSNAGFIYTLNLNSLIDSDEDIVDLLEYLVGDCDLNGNGFDGAQERTADGIYEKVNIKLWELGNETDLSTQTMWDAQTYVLNCERVLDIIEKYENDGAIPKIPKSAHISTHFSGYQAYKTVPYGRHENDYWDWTRDMLAALASRIDYVSIHSYYDEYSQNDKGDRVDFYTRINRKLGYVEEMIAESSNPDLKIAFTEHGRNESVIGSSGVGDRTGWNQLYNMDAAVSMSEYYNRVLMHDKVDIACYHSQSDEGPWMMTYFDNDGNMKATLPYEAMKLYADDGVGEVLKSTIGDFSKSNSCDYSASAIRNDNGDIKIFFSNRSEEEVKVSLSGLDAYTAVEKTIITSDSLNDYRGYSDPDTKSISCEGTIKKVEHNDNSNITLPKYSVVMLKLTPNKSGRIINAIFGDDTTVTVKGNIEKKNQLVSVLITDDSEILYLNDTITDKNGDYKFNFKFSGDLKDCDIKLWLDDKLVNASASIETITAVNELFEVSYDMSISEEMKAKVKIKNNYEMKGVSYYVILAEYSGNTLVNVDVSEAILLDEYSETEISMPIENRYNSYKVFVWNSFEEMQSLGTGHSY